MPRSTSDPQITDQIQSVLEDVPESTWRSELTEPDASAVQIGEFLNTQTLPDVLIEAYDTELFFLLDRRYRYPLDQIHMELMRHSVLHQNVPIDYNPLAADPDYLSIGPFSKLWQLYNPVLERGSFHLLRAYSRYDVYERVR